VSQTLRGQQEQLKRLVLQTAWIGDAPTATLQEIQAQMAELRRLIDQLEQPSNATQKRSECLNDLRAKKGLADVAVIMAKIATGEIENITTDDGKMLPRWL
jgi:hypothetical protein